MSSYRDVFPDVHDERPQVVPVQFDGDPTAIERRVLATAASFRVGDRLYVNIAPFGHYEEWVPAVVVDERAGVVCVKRSG